MRRRSAVGRISEISLPSIWIEPEVTSISRLVILSRVVFPQPDVPEEDHGLPIVHAERDVPDGLGRPLVIGF
jgi:hypothetical protein